MSVQVHVHAQVLTIEMRCVNVKACNHARHPKVDDAPVSSLSLIQMRRKHLKRNANVPIECWIVPPRHPSTVQDAIWSKLTFQAQCGLHEDDCRLGFSGPKMKTMDGWTLGKGQTGKGLSRQRDEMLQQRTHWTR